MRRVGCSLIKKREILTGESILKRITKKRASIIIIGWLPLKTSNEWGK